MPIEIVVRDNFGIWELLALTQRDWSGNTINQLL